MSNTPIIVSHLGAIQIIRDTFFLFFWPIRPTSPMGHLVTLALTPPPPAPGPRVTGAVTF
jgi:hypothetical protein